MYIISPSALRSTYFLCSSTFPSVSYARRLSTSIFPSISAWPGKKSGVWNKTKYQNKTYWRHNNVFPPRKISSHTEASTEAAHKPASSAQICQLSRTSPTCFQSLTAPEGMETPPPASLTGCQTLARIHAEGCKPALLQTTSRLDVPEENSSAKWERATRRLTHRNPRGLPVASALSPPLCAPRPGPPWGRMGSYSPWPASPRLSPRPRGPAHTPAPR